MQKSQDKVENELPPPVYSVASQGYLILAEYNLLRTHHPPGVYVVPDAENSRNWFGFVSVRSGYYMGGIFRLRLQLPSDFPSQRPPRVFLPKGFFHPYVYKDTGELALLSVSQWDPESDHMWHLLHQVRFVLTCPTGSVRQHAAEQVHLLTRSTMDTSASQMTTSCQSYPNPEATDLIVNDRTAFEIRARNCVRTLSIWCQTNTDSFGNPNLSIGGWDDVCFIDRAREGLKASEATEPPPSWPPIRGYSWLDPKTMTPFAIHRNDNNDSEG